MDASTIRLILIVVGAFLILVLYLWERRREKRAAQEEDDLEELGFDVEDETPGDARLAQRESQFAALEEDGDSRDRAWSYLTPRSSTKVEESSEAVRDSEDFGDSRDFDDSRALDEPKILDDPADRQDELEGEGSFPVQGDRDSEPLDEPDSEPQPELAPEPMSAPRLDPLLIQVSVSARRYPFKGTDVMEVAERCGLYPGEMDIFHCQDEFDDQTRIYFSMANMVKPGTFPFNGMETFSTPGLMLFAQLEGDPEDMTILDEMVATARKLALALNGDVLDDGRRPLTVKKEEEMRQAVLANEMRWAQAALR